MKVTKKALAIVLCLLMLSTSVINDGWSSLSEDLKASAMHNHEQNYNDARVELDFNKGWSFAFSEDEAAYLKGFDDSAWEEVDLPHDFSISQGFTEEGTEAESGNLPGGTGWYRKWFNLYDYYTGDRIIVNFDGAYQHAYVYVNGKYVGENHYGYNSFSIEISDYVICSNTELNLIAVKVVNDIPSSRWYSGSGIYRDVSLTIAGPVHTSLYGPQITTPDIEDGKGTVDADITIHNDAAISKKVTVEATILDNNHNPVSDTVVSDTVTISAETEKTVTLSPSISNPHLWSVDDPYLYILKTVVKNEDGEEIDEYHTTFGYRYIEWDADEGFSLNGEKMKLKGVCLHHDQGALGAASEHEALYRQIVTLKEMGCNAIRTSHNPASKALMEICNELGMLVMVEFFDGWDASKNYNDHDFSEYFNETIASDNKLIGAHGQKWYEFVVEQTILRDEHDPCVIAWDLGNELFNITGGESTANYNEIADSIIDITKELDSSRVVLYGNNNGYNEEAKALDNKMDVIGGNYSPDGWAYIMTDSSDPRSEKPFVATEAASAISSRGVYDTMSQYDFQCTSYDTNAVDWGNEAAEAWYYVATNDWYSGEFVWTGFDYIGEPTPWNNDAIANSNAIPNSSYFGVVDTAGFEKDSYYLYRSLWNEDSTTLHLVPGSWNEDNLLLNNGYVNVAVYSNAEKVELLLNGNVIATAASTVTTTPAGYTYRTWSENITDSSKCSVGSFYTGKGEDFYPQFNVKYAEGTLSVKAYDKNGNEITDTVGSTKSVTGTATQIAVNTWQDKDTYVADGTDYVYIEFEARDADGNFMNDYNGTLDVKVDDSSSRYAEIVGVDNGNPATTEKFRQSSVLTSESQATIQMFNGKALVILKTTEEEGTINLTAIATEGASTFSTQGITVTSVSETGVELTDEFEEVIVQSNKEYVPTLYDKYEVVKHHINNLEKPTGGSSGGSGESGGNTGNDNPSSDKYEIYHADTTVSEGCVADGNYIIYNQCGTNQQHIMTSMPYADWGVSVEYNLTETETSASGSPYLYDKFKTDSANEFSFTHLGNNLYYIQNASTGQYLSITSGILGYSDSPAALSVKSNENGSILIYSSNYYVFHEWDYFYSTNPNDPTADNRTMMWLYSAPGQEEEPSEPSTPPATTGDYYGLYTLNSDVNLPVEDGEYVISIDNLIMPEFIPYDTVVWDYGAVGEIISDDSLAAPSGSPYKYLGIKASEANEYSFISQGDGKYYIRHNQSGYYLYITSGTLWGYTDYPLAFTVTPNNDGSISISYATMYTGTRYIGIESPNNTNFDALSENGDNCKIWLYSDKVPVSGGGDNGDSGDNGNTGNVGSNEKLALYYALHSGIEEDYSIYTKDSFEELLTALEDGVDVFKAANSENADYEAATQAIYAAIEALKMDIKKINGTLFKYGYSNVNGTADYSSGGILMNDIAVRQMKNAILADDNLVRQIKDIIGYDDTSMGWTGNRADEILDAAAEAYAKIYTLQFTGVPYNGSSVQNAASNYQQIEALTTPPVSLWNLWTKNNTHGANDPGTIHDGASVQGLAGATLDDGVITSHSAYTIPLSYANDGPNAEHDITYYNYSFDAGSAWYTVQLDYLEGISVYFPDLFTRENLDANGNVTTSTTGEFAKYYWDTEFPMFISTDEYGVNTYHFDSKDTQYIVQSSFNDAEQTVDMELNNVDSWNIEGPNNTTKSGFFPFNYKQGTTSYTGENAVYHYGFTFEHNFYIPKGGKHVNGEDVVFNFSGDDDVYVYIDGVLVLDNGGLHGAREVTINFTDCTINYQYAMDVTDGVLKGDEFETTYSYNEYLENPDTCGYNADTIAALNKLHEVISDGEVHTLNFFYLERGASDSNCKISFNLSETSEDVRIIDQNLTLDYGLPVEYNITENNNISQTAIDNGVEIEYLGICSVNAEYTPTYTFEMPEIIIPFEDGVTYTIDGMKYGTCTIDNKGNVSYNLESTHMKDSENFYVVAKITGDPTYAEDVVYYQVEKTTFIPATAIYYEDTYDTITYTDGKVATNYDNSVNEFGLWKTEGMQSTTLKQTADLTDSEANPYGYESNYTSFAEYSGNSTHYVDVSTRNNPNQKYSGGTGGQWPTVDFTFTGTGFDLISVTDNTTGAFSVMVKNANGKTVMNTVVDTFYGYNYGRIYSDADGNPSLDDTLTPMYKSENGACTPAEMYYDENGAITDIAHYYDENGDVVETETDEPAYAYAYGWVVATDDSKETLYQIPVIKITDLEYGDYSVVITPTFTSSFRHSSTAEDGSSYYRVYLDAIKIYGPARTGDDITDEDVKDAYATDDELYPNYLEIKDMLIGADSLSEADKQGVIFIDGIAALDNDIPTYKNAGPNNELYLAKDQAVAFEIWATSVPTDVQIGTKLACGNPALTISYASKTTDMDIKTATDLYYSFNTILPNDAKLTWHLVTGADGNNYYTTGTIVVQNTGDEDSVLSITNIKWTFSQNGGKGYFRIPTPIENEVLTLSSTTETQAVAYSFMRMRTAALDVELLREPEIITDDNGDRFVEIKVKSSSDVESILVTDESGKEITPESVEGVSADNESEGIEWTITIPAEAAGIFNYLITGVYENGYADTSKAISVTVTIEPPTTDEPTTDEPTTDEPTTDEPTTDEPVIDEPTTSVTDFSSRLVYEILNIIRMLLQLIGLTF